MDLAVQIILSVISTGVSVVALIIAWKNSQRKSLDYKHKELDFFKTILEQPEKESQSITTLKSYLGGSASLNPTSSNEAERKIISSPYFYEIVTTLQQNRLYLYFNEKTEKIEYRNRSNGKPKRTLLTVCYFVTALPSALYLGALPNLLRDSVKFHLFYDTLVVGALFLISLILLKTISDRSKAIHAAEKLNGINLLPPKDNQELR